MRLPWGLSKHRIRRITSSAAQPLSLERRLIYFFVRTLQVRLTFCVDDLLGDTRVLRRAAQSAQCPGSETACSRKLPPTRGYAERSIKLPNQPLKHTETALRFLRFEVQRAAPAAEVGGSAIVGNFCLAVESGRGPMWWWQQLFGTRRAPASADRLGHALGSSLHEDRCIGSLLGCASGDILGANLEFQSRQEIQRAYGRVEDFLDSAERPLGVFTDDTEMTLALAVSLIECGVLDPKHCATTYARFFAAEPRRGYGPAVSHILSMLEAGHDYRNTGRAVYPEGSFANGGAMRIAPVGLAFCNATDTVLRQAVELALLCTHVHPDAVDGAFIQAKAVSELARTANPSGFDVARFLSSLISITQSRVLREKLGVVLRAHLQDWRDEEVLSAVCAPNKYGAQFQIHAAEAVACALWAFVCSPDKPEECLIRAVCLGGDTDTVGMMAGALAGALHGSSWIPCRWFDQMENAPGVGRDYLIGVARQLAKLDLRSVLAAPPRKGHSS